MGGVIDGRGERGRAFCNWLVMALLAQFEEYDCIDEIQMFWVRIFLIEAERVGMCNFSELAIHCIMIYFLVVRKLRR